jgi:membrane protein
VGWLVLLIGASVAFYCQHPEHQGLHRTRLALGGKALERLGLELACRVAQRFLQGESPLPLSMLAHELNAPTDSLRQVARRLEQAGLLRQIDDHDVLHLPARDLATITLSDIVIALRETGQDRGLLSAPARHGLAVERCAAKVDAAVAVALGDRTLRDLALESLDGVMVAEPEPGTSQAPVVIETDMNSPEGIAKP